MKGGGENLQYPADMALAKW